LNATISYYDRNARQFYDETVHADMSALYEPFLKLVPRNGRILDAGCGSGRDSHYFIQHGYQVEAFDASPEMCRLASSLIGQIVHLTTFDEIDWKCEFDGIWACASLLHVRRDSINRVLDGLCDALKPEGAMFMSFKLRDGEWEHDGRSFNGYTVDTFGWLIESHPALYLASTLVTPDVRPSHEGEKWLNAIVRPSKSLLAIASKP
jgi:SAM-dependent methyltransferase